MAKRMIVMLAVTVVFIAAIGFVKFRQVKAAMAVYASFQPPPEAVTTIVARQERWPATLGAIGTVAAGSRRDGQRRPAGHRRSRSASIPAQTVKEGDMLVSSTPGRSRRN